VPVALNDVLGLPRADTNTPVWKSVMKSSVVFTVARFGTSTSVSVVNVTVWSNAPLIGAIAVASKMNGTSTSPSKAPVATEDDVDTPNEIPTSAPPTIGLNAVDEKVKGKVNARLPDAGTLTPYETTEKSSVLLEVPVAMERHLQAYAPPAVIVNEVIEICCPTAILVLSSSISPPPEVTEIDPCIWHDVPPELCTRK
jgi:hypothetical protein